MRKMSARLLFVGLMLACGGVRADGTEHNLRAVDEHIIPGYQSLLKTTVPLSQDAAAFCDAPSEKRLQQLREDFHIAMDAWQRVQHIRFGPIEFSLRQHRIQMWPDKRGSVGKHLRRFIAKQSPKALGEDQFIRSSVAVQGFSALERLLFGKQSSPEAFAGSAESTYKCELLKAITVNLKSMASNLVRDWLLAEESHRHFIATASQKNAFYDSDVEVASKLLNNLYTQMQFIVDEKLIRALGSSQEKARGKRSESWRSQRSLRNLRHNLEATREFYRAAFAPRIGDADLNKAIETAFQHSLEKVGAIAVPLVQAVAEPDHRPAVMALRQETSKLKKLLGVDLPRTAKLPLGFNSLDGD